MHSANFTAFSCAVRFMVARVLVVLPALLAVSVLPAVALCEAAFEPQPALNRPIRAASPRAINGRGFLLILVTDASLDRAWGRRTWRGSPHRRPLVAARSARARWRRSGTGRTRRRARTATRPHGRARCRPRPPSRARTGLAWPPIGRLPLLS